ncbi:MAG TPA: beta-ketoacyl-[acyl-carrier-protein] synthase family protein [Candidatus Margulisiibacteriota bacterium]|nr:beta-ketoacyl-[acyl-carrier-protein] synthase family protein [Candidatus Margulisiibacteriota bacterium]
MDATPQSVAVTGLGVISPIGIGRDAFWSALCAGQSGIAPLATTEARVPRLAARIPEFAARHFIRSSHLRRADGLSRSIVCAARMALADAGLPHALPPERLGIVVGSALGDVAESAQYLARLFTKGPSLVSPMMFPNLVLNAPASYAAMELGCTGANLTVSHGEISGEQAIALGCDLIRAGRADVVLAGGGDQFAEIVVAAYRDYRALSSQRGGPEWCSPYDVDRNGIILGEGAAMLVLESAQHVRRRAATAYAELVDYVSFGVPAPAYDWPLRAPAAAGPLRELIARCLGSSTDTGVDVVCGSANSSRRLDACEIDVLARVFGEAAPRMALTSIKGAIGEFGAAGALSAVATCLALREAIVPPLCNLTRAPTDAPFRFAVPRAERRPLQTGLMLSMARGGGSIALLFRRSA